MVENAAWWFEPGCLSSLKAQCLSLNLLLQHSNFRMLKSALGRFPYQTKQVRHPSCLIHERPKTVKLHHCSPGSAFYCHLQHNWLWLSLLSEQGYLFYHTPSQNASYLLSPEDTSLLNIGKTAGTCSEGRACAAWPGVGAGAFGQHHGLELCSYLLTYSGCVFQLSPIPVIFSNIIKIPPCSWSCGKYFLGYHDPWFLV